MSAKAEFMKTWMREQGAEGVRRAPPSAGGGAAHESAGAGIEASRDVIGVPKLGAFADMDYFYLLGPLEWRPNEGPLRPVRVPPGFVTDLASVPSYFWSVASPQGRHGVAAIIHDWLYWKQDCARDEADAIFDRIMQDLSVPTWKRLLLYYGVRWRAGQYWTEYERDRKAGSPQPRILKRFPDHATITWEQWRNTPDVFA